MNEPIPTNNFARFEQLMFAVAALVSCWIGMMAVHEFGHVIGAMLTGGKVAAVVLHPLSISRTDVSPNPYPGIVVWSGPVFGCLLPLLLIGMFRKNGKLCRGSLKFFAGFCCVANGAYILFGSFDGVGDCRQMVQAGSPQWTLILFGVLTLGLGFTVWHRLGSIIQYWKRPEIVSGTPTILAMMCMVVAILASICLSSA